MTANMDAHLPTRETWETWPLAVMVSERKVRV